MCIGMYIFNTYHLVTHSLNILSLCEQRQIHAFILKIISRELIILKLKAILHVSSQRQQMHKFG